MAIFFKNLIASKYAEAAQVSQYTAVNAQAIIDKFTATNTTSDYVTFSANLVIGGGSPGGNNLLVDNVIIEPHQTYFLPELVGHVLEENSYISTLASAANSIVIRMSGREIT